MIRVGGIVAGIVVALALAAPASAQQQPAGNSEAQQNVRQSEQYQQLVCSNAKFRATRIAKECGPLQGSQFYDSCVQSFNCGNQPAVNPRAVPPSERMH